MISGVILEVINTVDALVNYRLAIKYTNCLVFQQGVRLTFKAPISTCTGIFIMFVARRIYLNIWPQLFKGRITLSSG